MKSMTCAEMGGPCQSSFQGSTADEVIKAQDHHLKAMVANGDQGHRAARMAMQGRWRRPVTGIMWYANVKKDFAAQPDD
jgi:hypothetical protein